MGVLKSFALSTLFDVYIDVFGYTHLFKMSKNLILLQTPVQNPEVENTSILNFRKNPAPQPNSNHPSYLMPNRGQTVIISYS